MRDTRERICKAAKRLFDEKPYNEVTMRGIADEVGIAIGNLNYYFPKKGDLICYMQKGLFDSMESDIAAIMENEYSLHSLVDMIDTMQKNRNENRFLYCNMSEIIRDVPQMAENSNHFVEIIYRYFVSCFSSLREKNIMRTDIEPSCYDALAYNYVYMTQVWMMSGTLYDNQMVPRQELSGVMLNGLVAYLTEDGRKEFEALRADM